VKVIVAGVEYPLTMSTAEVAEMWSCSPQLLQSQVGSGKLPVEPLTLGCRYRWPTILVAQAMGLPVVVDVTDGHARLAS
jgi:hypothetical protein